ncbi:MAG: DUF4199 domain-containing protein [Prevotellaceae bacterium]|jgi:hypothetical protein|nr:DUF4199 domain-containing protein [Prevotellaceae bacterium]
MKHSFIQNAARDGLLLGALAVLFLFIPASSFVLTAVLTVVKLGATIGLFGYLLRRQSAHSEAFTYATAIGYGTLAAAFSAFILGVVYFLQFTVINPELTETLLLSMTLTYERMGMSEMVDTVEDFRPYLPYLVFIICLFYYTLIGFVYSLVFGFFVKHRTPPVAPPFN